MRLLRGRIASVRKAEHTQWLIRRLPHMLEIKDPQLLDLVEYQKEALFVLVISRSEEHTSELQSQR